MPLLARHIPSPLSVDVRPGAIAGLTELLRDRRISSQGQVAVVVGPGQGDQIVAELQLDGTGVFPVEGGSVRAALELVEGLREGYYDAVVGIGGGRTLDVAKYAASITGLPMVSVATNLAHDGIASPVASLEHDGRKGSYGVQMPIAVVVDIDYVRRCPSEQLRSGVGDALSNVSALADWELASRERGEPFDGVAGALARAAAESVLGRTDGFDSDGFLTALAEALILSGLAMAAAGSSRPCSGACHEISHAIDALYPDKATHGEQVAVGALFASFLREDGLLDELEPAYSRLGIARVPGDLALTDDDFAAAVAEAPSTRPDRYTILEHLDLDENAIRDRVGNFVDALAR
jgi:glycerol-1-phosphate dehydrogenase [NAD(P)+]